MATDTYRMPLAAAQLAAEQLLAILGPACERIEIAGSIRRGAARVKEVELVAIARTETTMGGLFNDVPEQRSALGTLLDQLEQRGELTPRKLADNRRIWAPAPATPCGRTFPSISSWLLRPRSGDAS